MDKFGEVRARRINVARDGRVFVNDYAEIDVEECIALLEALIETIETDETELPVSEDTPRYFNVLELPDQIEAIASAVGGSTLSHVENLVNRIRVMLSDVRLHPIIAPEPSPEFPDWLKAYLGSDDSAAASLAILDLSLVPSDVIHIAIAVIARITFEAMQRYRKANQESLPTVLVLEEAHNFARQDGSYQGELASAADACRETFERIAREGRKYGLGLVLSSQRPSELSPTVLAQCNTFLLHRIVNDLDQRLVRRLVPDSLGLLLAELPSLPTQQAVLLGWATPMPVLTRMRDLPEEQRPSSEDPAFWKVWTQELNRPVDWQPIASDWQAHESVQGQERDSD